jgi:hypothetical protein
MATTGNNIRVPDDLLAELEVKAAAEGTTADDLVAETLRESLRDRSWQTLLFRGRKYGEASGITEDQVPEVVRDWRNEQRER